MRFEQLKRYPNTILKKKLYKSGKNWVVATSLLLAEGIAIGTSSMVVKADDVKSTSNTPQTESTQQMPSKTDSSGAEASVGTADPSVSEKKQTDAQQIQGQSSVANEDTTPKSQSTAMAPASLSKTVKATAEPSSETLQPLNAPSTVGSGTVTTQGLNDPSNLASSTKFGKVGSGQSDDGKTTLSGSDWYLNKDGELHIEAGEWAAIPLRDNSFWYGMYYDEHYNSIPSAVTKIVFDGKVVAGKNISELFRQMSGVTSIENFDYFDTSNTENFTQLFLGDKKLDQFVLPNLSKAKNISDMYLGTAITSASLKDMNIPSITNYSGLFSECAELTSADLSGFTAADGSDFNGMFSGDTKLRNINMSGINIGPNIPQNEDMFSNNSSLDSLDLSAFKNVNDAANAVNFNYEGYDDQKVPFTLTVNNSTDFLDQTYINSGFKNTNFSYDTNKYEGWIINDGDTPLTSAQMMNLYNGDTTNSDTHADANGNTTWKLKERDKIDATINYWTANQDQSKDKPVASRKLAQQYIGSTLTVSVIPGYSDPSPTTVEIPKSGIVNVIVTALAPYSLKINVSYGDNPDNSSSETADLPARTTDVSGATDFQKALDNLPNYNETLDLNNTKITIPSDYDGNFETDSLQYLIDNDYFEFDNTSDLKSVINKLLGSLINDYGYDETVLSGYNNQPIFVDAVYTKYEAPAVTHPSSGGSSSGDSTSEENGVIKDIKQTSATFSDRPKAKLYDAKGEPITNLFLSPDSSWYNDESMELNGQKYYRVATDEWANADDVYIYTANDTLIRVYHDNFGHLLDAHGQATTNRELSPSSDWFSDRYVEMNGQKYYRVATNEFVSANEVYEYTKASATITTKNTANLYDEKGQLLTEQLPANASYKVDRFQTIDGSIYYRVANNQFVRAVDVIL
ncbi:BspA family leucine-rich repeat surface protein [Companilactobacillus huachuanensis]|uniref:BspA family leucine-rich repeat surface protein n=1 Tax=Companilactobacillus huachuanensis TaxID=2559914 RepID=A0ABW1RLU7_9LACO|nr:SLAP domain-containing protein [Companilactobacillus huachuanensis]